MVASKIIVYACPTGELSDQLERFYARSREEIGENKAHAYMPHCTLTGFFHDRENAIPFYADLLDRLIAEARPFLTQPVMEIRGVHFAPEFHGLVLESRWLKGIIAEFKRQANSPTRTDVIRPKDWLHLSLAYGFLPEQQAPLKAMAEEMVDPTSPVGWEVRLYERHPDNRWACHRAWPVANPE